MLLLLKKKLKDKKKQLIGTETDFIHNSNFGSHNSIIQPETNKKNLNKHIELIHQINQNLLPQNFRFTRKTTVTTSRKQPTQQSQKLNTQNEPL